MSISPSQTHHQRKKMFWIRIQGRLWKTWPDNWEQRRKKSGTNKSKREQEEERLMKLKEDGKSLYSLENVKRDYRVMKQRIHAGLWVKEIEKMEEANLTEWLCRLLVYNMSKIASFIKQHKFSRRRLIDGWKYMIEELGPDAKRGSKGSASRFPSFADPATQPFMKDKILISTTKTRGR
ncbi:hypothetical protein Tco_0961109 [Tanacetum coccineum]